MFDQSSRYNACKDLTIVMKDGKLVRYKERRMIPKTDNMQVMQQVIFTAGDRLDLISARTLGDPESFWHICDSNETIHPLELTNEVGKAIRIAIPWVQGWNK